MHNLSFLNLLQLLLGFFVGQNIVWVYKGNSASYLYIETFIAFVLFLSTFRKISFALSITEKNLKRYLLYTICIIPYSLTIFWGTQYELTPLKGCLSMLLSFMLFCVVLMSYQDSKYIMRGVYWGFIVSFLYSFLCFIFYQIGITWRVIDYFNFEGSKFASYTSIYYRAQGFFVECSYYMCYLASVVPIFLYYCKNDFFKLIVLLGLFFLGVMSFSGNIVFFLASIGLYVIFVEKNIFLIKQIGMFFPVFIVIFVIYHNRLEEYLIKLDFIDFFNTAFDDLNVNDDANISNVIRMNVLIHTLEQIPMYPFGVGYGCSSPLLEMTYSKIYGDQSTYSFALKVLLESGWLGFGFYIMAIFKIVKTLFRGDRLQRMLAISLLMATICQTTNGIGWFSFILTILAFSNLKCYDNKILIDEPINFYNR